MKASLSFGTSRILVLLIALGFAQTAFATSPDYIVTTSSGASIVPGTDDIGNHTDDGTTGISLPFPVIFYDEVFTSANVSSNGNLQFSSSNAQTSSCLPNTDSNNVIAPAWRDLRTDGTNGEGAPEGIFTSVSGTAPNRIFNIEWRTEFYGAGGTAHFEARLYEGQQRIDFIYATATNTLGGIGVQRDTGSQSTVVSCNSTPASGTQYTFTIPPHCADVPPNMIAWWPGDGNADDIQGGHHGTLLGGATFGAGEVAEAFSFDGAEAEVSVPNSPAWNFGSSDFTIDTWVNFNSLSGSDVFVAHDEGEGGSSYRWIFRVRENNLEFQVGGSSGAVDISVPFTPNTGQWYHVAVTRSGDTFKFYVDGVQIGGDQTVSVVIPDANTPLTLGHAGEIPSLDGLLDEVEIFNRALDASEIASIYIAGPLGKCRCTPPPPDMVSWWPAEGNADDIQGANNGALQGGATFTTGNVGQAFSFSGAQDSYVEITDHPSLNPTNAFTIDGWFYIDPNAPGNIGEVASLVAKTTGGVGDGGWFLWFQDSAAYTKALRFDILTAGSPAWPYAEVNNIIPSAGWYHIAGVFDLASDPQAKLYVNGALAASSSSTISAILNNSLPMRIGASHWSDTFGGNDRLNGLADEVEFFSRALAESEIQAIYNAGSAGKCRPCTPAPTGMLDWWPGDGNANDIQGSHGGTLKNGATFAPGKVAQAFSLDGSDDYVDVGDVDLPATFTIDAWINPASISDSPLIISKDDSGSARSYYFGIESGGTLILSVFNAGGAFTQYRTNSSVISTGAWQHVAAIYDGSQDAGQRIKISVNGVNAPASPTGPYDAGGTPADNSLSAKLGVSGDGATGPFNGLIDEVEIFDHVLSQSEIEAIYDAGSGGKCKPAVPTERQLANISSRADVGTGSNVAIGGFIIHSDQGMASLRGNRVMTPMKSVLIRGIGPSLGITGQLEDPFLELRDSNGVLIISNDNWGDAANAGDIPSGLVPSDANEAAILRTLDADSAYTAILSGAGETTGIGLVEVYDLDVLGDSHLANISTRAFVSTGPDVLIGGIIVQGGTPTRVVLRGIGPSLTAQGVSTALLDPILELHDGNGALLETNDDWPSSPEAAAITASGLAPTDTKESAILFVPAPGNYTAIVSGVGDTTGVGLVEAYNIGPPPPPPTTWYQDADLDGYGNPLVTVQAYSAPPGYVANNTDCNDSNASVHPGATETCNGVDDNCDGQIDEGVTTTFYQDADGDGYGNPLVTVQACSAPAGYVANNTDCDDGRAPVHPGATEVCENGIDDNCNAQVDEGCPP